MLWHYAYTIATFKENKQTNKTLKPKQNTGKWWWNNTCLKSKYFFSLHDIVFEADVESERMASFSWFLDCGSKSRLRTVSWKS